jgi:hypothetical protein
MPPAARAVVRKRFSQEEIEQSETGDASQDLRNTARVG